MYFLVPAKVVISLNLDVTAGYIMLDVERLRKPMQIIAEHLLLQMGLKQSTIIPAMQE